MLTASAFLFLVLNLAPSPTIRLLHHGAGPAACFAVAAAADTPTSLRGRELQQQAIQGFILSKPPSGTGDPTSFAALVWGNNSTTTSNNNNNNAPNSNQPGTGLQQSHQQPQQGLATGTGSGNYDDARYMIHLQRVNSSSWRDPAGVTFYQAEYRASNTATRDICDVKVGIPLGNIDANQVQINNSYAMKIDEPSSAMTRGSGEQGNMLTATLQAPYFRPGVRIREAVDMGFVLQSNNGGIAGTGQATVLSARYCTEESRASVPPPTQQEPQQQQGAAGPQQQEPEAEDGRTWPIRNFIQRWRQGGDE